MEHRHDDEEALAHRYPDRIRETGLHRVQDVRAVRIEHALREARRPRRVTKPGRRALVQRVPREIVVGLGDPVLVGDCIGQGGLWHVRRIGQDNIGLDRRQSLGERLEQRHEGEVDHHHAIFRMIDDPGDLIGEQARVDRMTYRPDASDPVPGLDVAPGVPGQCRDPVAGADTGGGQAFGHPQGAGTEGCIIGAVDRTLDGASDHLARAMLGGGVVDDPMQQQRPILHQTQHVNASQNDGSATIRAIRQNRHGFKVLAISAVGWARPPWNAHEFAIAVGYPKAVSTSRRRRRVRLLGRTPNKTTFGR